MKPKRILSMQDLSCVGQCSLTVALPILSRYGVETCVLPTAVLSNHTQFRSWSYLDLTEEIPAIFAHWQESGILFDGFLLGYLGKKSLMSLAEECFDRFGAPNSPVIIDPVFADEGKLYSGFDLEYVQAMAQLITRADIIDPNVTEACFLTSTPYDPNYDKIFVEELAHKLSRLTNATVVITGVEFDGKIGELIFDGKTEYVMLPKLPAKYHGTGDIFSSVMSAHYLGGKRLSECCLLAGQFVADCMRATPADHPYGVCFETRLKQGD